MPEYLTKDYIDGLSDEQLSIELEDARDGLVCPLDVSLLVQSAIERGLVLEGYEVLMGIAKSMSSISDRLRAMPDCIPLSAGYVGLDWREIGAVCAVSRHMKCRERTREALEAVGIPADVGDPSGDSVPMYDLALVKSADWREEQKDEASFTPPQSVAEAAERGLELRRRFRRGGTEVGVARARDLSNRRPVSQDTLGRMRSFFARHGAQVDRRDAGWGSATDPSAQYIAWLLWGGDAGRDWALRNKPEEEAYATPLAKSEGEWKVMYYLVSEPETEDAHGDKISADEIRKALHGYMSRPKREVRYEHGKEVTGRAEIVEGFIAPCDIHLYHGVTLEEPIKAGSSVVGMYFEDDRLWDAVKDGDGGISWGGMAVREKSDD